MKSNDEMLVESWNAYVDWEKRNKGENGFIAEKLREHSCKLVYDLALGGGYDSINLLEQGFKVVMNELDPNFVELTNKNAEKKLGCRLEPLESGIPNDWLGTYNYSHDDWREMCDFENWFDAEILMGNSFSYLMNEEDQRTALANFYNILKYDGILIIDNRNYDYILREKEEILKGNFKYTRKINYCGEDVISYPIVIHPHIAIFEFLNKKTGENAYMTVYPILEERMKKMLKETGFRKIETYYDYKSEKPEHYDFVQHIAVR
jgi:SAM-dependent methyltransferase